MQPFSLYFVPLILCVGKPSTHHTITFFVCLFFMFFPAYNESINVPETEKQLLKHVSLLRVVSCSLECIELYYEALSMSEQTRWERGNKASMKIICMNSEQIFFPKSCVNWSLYLLSQMQYVSTFICTC